MKIILIIEDDRALRENTAELLELANYKVFTAPNGKVGVEIAKTKLPDLIICDIMMPELDGYGVLEAVSLEITTAHIPFIFLSAKTEYKEIRKGMDLGADDYLTKPFEEDELLKAVESRLARVEIFSKIMNQAPENEEKEGDIQNLNELKNFFDDTGDISNFKKGEIIFSEGAHSNKVYLILKGIVKSCKIEENGKELITALHSPDEFLGFTSFSENISYQETATAVEDTTLAGLSKSDLKDILSHNKNVSLELINVLTKSVYIIKEQLLQMAYCSVRKKTAKTILQFVNILNVDPKDAIKISRSDLASVAGIATESLIRTLSEFKKNGLIEIEGRNIKVLNLKKLEEVE